MVRRRLVCATLAAGLLAALAPVQAAPPAQAVFLGDRVALGQTFSPDSTLSTAGDYATDTFGDPWDFSNEEDSLPIPGVGTFQVDSASIANGVLSMQSRDASEVRLMMEWGHFSPVLPWGRDGWSHPIDANRYTQTTFRIRADATMNMSVRWWNAAGEHGAVPFQLVGGDWQTFHFDLTDRKNYPFPGADAVWGGSVVWFELFRAPVGGNPAINLQVDWVRLHRADASREPNPNVPVPQVLSPGESSGADYATSVLGNPWDFHGMDDVAGVHDVANLAITPDGDLTGITTGNDPSIAFPLGPTLNTDRFHHLTLDVCLDGAFNLEDIAGGGMVGRIAWIAHSTGTWIETQAFVVFPGCHTISMDMVTDPVLAINATETGARPTGWRGVRMDVLRFDLNEDRGHRGFRLRNVTLTDDSQLTSNFPIAFRDSANTSATTADIFVSTARGSFTGTRIAHDVPVGPNINTYNWNGTDDKGNVMPNAPYWVYVVMRNGSGTGVEYSTGTVRVEKPVPSTPSYFVPLTPARVLDTRDGTGGNIFPLADDTLTEVRVTGVGGVPQGDVTAVVMNVTATDTSGDGYITAWPSGEPRPLVSNVNFVPGQTVPNLVTVKVGVNGKVNLYNSAGSTNLIADVAGYYTTTPPPSGGKFTSLTPTRLLDTRDGTGGRSGPLGLNGQLNLTVTGVGGVPSTGVTAVALNVTVDQPTGNGYLTVWPAGEARPTASTHNYVPGLTVANLVLAKVGANGQVSVYNSAGQTHVVADVIGYFSSSGGLFVPVSPQRVVDTRDNTGGVPGQLGPDATRTMAMTTGPIPTTAKAVVVNITSVDSTEPSFITAWPTVSNMPLASTLNPRPGVAVPNQAYLRLGTGGNLNAFNDNGSTNAVVDVFGYFTG